MGHVMLNVNTVTSPFYKGQTLAEHLNARGMREAEKEAHLAKLRVYVNFDRTADPSDQGQDVNSFSRRTKTLAGLGDAASRQKINDGTNTTVWDHLRRKYPNDCPDSARTLRTGNVGKKEDAVEPQDGEHYLASQLTVLSGQRYKGSLSSYATNNMIDAARRSPVTNCRMIMGEGMTSLQLQNPPYQKLLNDLGITIGAKMIKVSARLIPGTDIRYGNKNVEIDAGYWDITKTKVNFLDTDNGYNNNQPTSEATVRYFYPRERTDGPDRLNEKKLSKKYNKKLTDYMRNIILKLNLRCGNTNHSITKNALEAVVGTLGECETMILGADVTHPGAGSVPHAPSIAAVVGSIDNDFQQCPGSMRLNKARQEWIEDMKDMTMERLRLWYDRNYNTLPKRILYYRDGVRDSYLAKIRETEVREIQNAWEQVRDEKELDLASTVQITAVVVTKRHHTRLYPINHSNEEDNCPPGTVVDSGIAHPYYFDFYLQSHFLPTGTAKPAHYLVIRNDMDLSPKTLQDFIYHLCYTYGRSFNAVSYAPHAYYADRPCERGRLYLKPFFEQASTIKTMLNREEARKGTAFTRELAEEAVMKQAKQSLYRDQKLAGNKARNRWHEKLDGKMFWM